MQLSFGFLNETSPFFLLPFDCYSFSSSYNLRCLLKLIFIFFLCTLQLREKLFCCIFYFLSFLRHINFEKERQRKLKFHHNFYACGFMALECMCVQSSGIKTGSRVDSESQWKLWRMKIHFLLSIAAHKIHIVSSRFNLFDSFHFFLSLMEKRLCEEKDYSFFV